MYPFDAHHSCLFCHLFSVLLSQSTTADTNLLLTSTLNHSSLAAPWTSFLSLFSCQTFFIMTDSAENFYFALPFALVLSNFPHAFSCFYFIYPPNPIIGPKNACVNFVTCHLPPPLRRPTPPPPLSFFTDSRWSCSRWLGCVLWLMTLLLTSWLNINAELNRLHLSSNFPC